MLNIEAALAHFKETDRIMAELFGRALKCQEPIIIPTPKPPKEYFNSITRSIVSQQISTKAAAAVYGRVLKLLGKVTPENVLFVSESDLRACGLSSQKTKYIRHNAALWHEVPVRQFKNMSDEEIIAELTKLYGIGRWTAEMFLMFTLARPNVFSYGDLGLMQSLTRQYQLKPHWNKKIETTVDAWSPHKTLASLTLWFHKDTNGGREQVDLDKIWS